ncbi:undecaprenyl-diphosphatase UppP [Candidatus Nomurabacteria bacterium]|nr:undecaprenyl-diphosphatase UppP [Candidatus Nomurabacteria bacterium]
MESIIQPIAYGLVQGLGEFLPISSTAHLILLPYFFNWNDPGLTFDIALHLGTLFAVLAFFLKDWINIFSSAVSNLKTGGIKTFKNELLYFLIIATIPGAIFGMLLENKVETIFRSPILIALALIIMGTILFYADKKISGGKDIKEINFKDAILIGLSQAFAIIPGVSRSGVTITAGLFRNFNKISAARFSFLLSTPIIFGATILKLPELIRSEMNLSVILAIIVSAVSGFLAIKYMLKFLEKFSYKIFFWYRLILGVIILITVFLK